MRGRKNLKGIRIRSFLFYLLFTGCLVERGISNEKKKKKKMKRIKRRKEL